MAMIRARFSRILVIAALAVIPAGCGNDGQHAGAQAVDPAMAEALEDQLMVDADLSQQNYRNYAVVPAAPANPALPTVDAPPAPGQKAAR